MLLHEVLSLSLILGAFASVALVECASEEAREVGFV